MVKAANAASRAAKDSKKAFVSDGIFSMEINCNFQPRTHGGRHALRATRPKTPTRDMDKNYLLSGEGASPHLHTATKEIQICERGGEKGGEGEGVYCWENRLGRHLFFVTVTRTSPPAPCPPAFANTLFENSGIRC